IRRCSYSSQVSIHLPWIVVCRSKYLDQAVHPSRRYLMSALKLVTILLATAIMILAGCQPSRDAALADAGEAQAELLRKVEPKQSLPAFGGTLIGKDEGEWGGEVAFREPDGTTYTVVADNSHGIFEMPYGVIALTGLAHLGGNRGTVHLLSRTPGARVSARPLMQLPGAPCDVVRVGDRINMRIP